MTDRASIELPVRTATRYVQPLREGGSLPAVVDTDDGFFVVKFRGAGQGPRALVAEIIVGELARGARLPVPELAVVEVPEAFGRSEPDPEIRDLLRASHGVNIGLRYLDGAFNYDARAAGEFIAPDLAAEIVWLDAFVTNPDRTARNPNLLICRREPWLIDHGSALYIHHRWPEAAEIDGTGPFPRIADHVLLARASDLSAADERMTARVTDATIDAVVAAVPDTLLGGKGEADRERSRYRSYLRSRLARRGFVEEALQARRLLEITPPKRRHARR